MNKYIFTSESVSEGNPDKVCDAISDAILDKYLEGDPNSRVARETRATTGNVFVSGEITSKASINGEQVVRNTLKEIGYRDKVEKLVLKQATLIKKAGLKGIVASGSEAKIIRKKYKNLFILTPGIRLPGDKANDQSRILSPKAALQAGASAIVLGRSIHSGNIKQNIKRLIDHLN